MRKELIKTASITKRGNTFRIRVACGFDGNGKRLTRSITYTPPPTLTPKQAEKEAHRQAVIFEERCRTGQILDTNTRFCDFVEIWLHDYAEKQLRPTTLARYKALLVRILAAFGNMKISAIQPHHLNAFYDNLSESGIRADIKYTPCREMQRVIKEKGFTKAAFSEKAGVSIQVLNSCTAGRNVTTASAEKIAAALNADVSTLFEKQEDAGLSGKTILHYHRLISTIMTCAVQWQAIFSNPCDRVKPPKISRKEARYLDEVGAEKLIAALEGKPYKYAVMVQLLLYTGLRRGELFGLEWHDVDFFTNCLHIERSVLYIAERGVFEDTTKTETSKRVIKLPDNAVNLLKAYQQWQNEQKEEIGSEWHKTDRLFTAWNGEPMLPDTLTSWFHDFIRRKGLPDVSIHSLRHTNATLMIAGGVPIKTVSSRLGHASLTTTANIYAHAIKSADEAAADVLNNLLSPTESSKRRKLG